MSQNGQAYKVTSVEVRRPGFEDVVMDGSITSLANATDMMEVEMKTSPDRNESGMNTCQIRIGLVKMRQTPDGNNSVETGEAFYAEVTDNAGTLYLTTPK